MAEFGKILCERPIILLHHNFDFLFRKYGCVVIKGRVVARFGRYRGVEKEKFFPKRNGITLDNMKDCYFLNDVTGELFPLYFAVPCGRCLLCRDKKARELSVRCICETNKFEKVPLFLTFTYAPQFLPECGLQKSDIQMFLKRLRSRLDYYGIDHNLRYLYVGEYGSKTHRAHYHMILWNFPESSYFPNILAIQKFIQRCWSRYIMEFDSVKNKMVRVPVLNSKGEVLRFPTGKIVYKTEPIGWIKTLPVTAGCAGYVLKYMRKDCVVPAGKNPTFMCASNRGGGIGSDYIRSQKDFFIANPSLTSFEVLDKVNTGRVFKLPITPYVKNLILPSASTAVPKKQYEVMKEFQTDMYLFVAVCQRLRELKGYDTLVDGVVKHWYEPFFDYKTRSSWLNAFRRTSFLKKCLYPVTNFSMQFLKTEDDCWKWFVEISDRLDLNSVKILSFPDYRLYFCERDKFMKQRSDILSELFSEAELYNITYSCERIRNNVERNKHKEVF